MSPELEVEEEVRAALGRDTRISNPMAIAISVKGGTVTLRGAVGSFKQRHAAVEIASSSAGVDEVVDDLQVRLLDDDVRDDALLGAVLQRLTWDTEVPSDLIEVKVRDGWVTLRGRVKHQHQSDAAFDEVASTKGVGGITNEIKVVTAG